MASGDELIKFESGKYAGASIGNQWRRMDEGRVLWWYPKGMNIGRFHEPTRELPKDVQEVVKKYEQLGGFADMTICQFVIKMFEDT